MTAEKLKGRTLQLGPIKVIFTKKSDLVLICPPRGESAWADHLTLSLPDDDTDAEHDFAPHLTRRTKGNKRRAQPLSESGVSLGDLYHLFKEYERKLALRWLAYTRPAELGLFAAADYWVAAVREDDPQVAAMCSTLFKCFEFRDGGKIGGLPNLEQDVAALSCAFFDVMLDSLSNPLDLDDCKDSRQPLSVLRFPDEGPPEHIGMLRFFPEGLPTGNWKSGWYLTHSNWMTPDDAKEWAIEMLGGRLMETLEMVMRAFGHERADDDGE